MIYRAVFLSCMCSSFALSSWAALAVFPPPPPDWWPLVAGLCVAAILLAGGAFAYCYGLNHGEDDGAADAVETAEIPVAMMEENILRKYYSGTEKD